MNEHEKQYRVGDTIKGDWVISGIHKWKNYDDLELIQKETSDSGSLRIFKN